MDSVNVKLRSVVSQFELLIGDGRPQYCFLCFPVEHALKIVRILLISNNSALTWRSGRHKLAQLVQANPGAILWSTHRLNLLRRDKMSGHFASIPLSNARTLCIGGITAAEARDAADNGIDIDGYGFYLFLAAADNPRAPIEILAKFFSSDQAEMAARLLPAS